MRGEGDILLVSCYELGHAPHGLAMPAAFLRRAGFAPAVLDLATSRIDPDVAARARVIAISVPMHTALRLALAALPRLRALAPGAVFGFFGHYAVLHASTLRELGAAFALGGEMEEELVATVRAMESRGRGTGSETGSGSGSGSETGSGSGSESETETGSESGSGSETGGRVSLVRLRFPAPDRSGLLPPERYAHLIAADGGRRAAGYTEASRGCLDTCRHCPVPAVYRGRFFVVDRETVLADVADQVAAGARHITFGDPDFLNGPRHALAVAREVGRRFPGVTFDITAQVVHLLRAREHLAELVELGCAFATTAVESLSDRVLAALAKRHRRADVERLLDLGDAAGLVVRPTFVPFTPWTRMDDLVDLVEFLVARDLIDRMAPVQLSIRLLVPPGSLLLEAEETRAAFGPLDRSALGHSWRHPDPRVDDLQRRVAALVDRDAAADRDPVATMADIRRLVLEAAGAPPVIAPLRPGRKSPRLSEPWFC
jgi:radical SAM superfamily enzyme YgiQ (UPF0313 family)